MVTETLPATIVARLEALGADLMACVRQHRDAPLSELERSVLDRIWAAQSGLLEAVVWASTTSLAPSQQRVRLDCPACGARTGFDSERPRLVRTICGPIHLERPWYVCAGCGQGWSPTDTVLGLAPRARLSVGLQAWLGRLGAATTFVQGAALLHELSGQAVSREAMRQHSERQGRALAAAQEQAGARVLASGEAAE